MIEFIKKFLVALSDSELDHFQREVDKESELRGARKRQQFGSQLPDLDDNEKAYVTAGRKIEAIKAYRDRTGFLLKQANYAVEYWLRPQNEPR